MMAFLQLNHLTKTYLEGSQRHPVLQDVTLDFDGTGISAILGKSGSGKTTLLNLISGIDQADSGEISIDGRSLTAMDDNTRTLFRRQYIGIIFQFFNLIPTLSVWENVILPLELNGRGKNGDWTRAEDLLQAVGLLDRKKAFPDRLSGGEQQRVAIARALVHDPLLVLADEPTGNLDETTGRHIMDLLDSLTRRAGKNLILVTHSAEAAAAADRVYTLHAGQLTLAEPAKGQKVLQEDL
jgi:putative ABC transport system ATP-binding protein